MQAISGRLYTCDEAIAAVERDETDVRRLIEAERSYLRAFLLEIRRRSSHPVRAAGGPAPGVLSPGAGRPDSVEGGNADQAQRTRGVMHSPYGGTLAQWELPGRRPGV